MLTSPLSNRNSGCSVWGFGRRGRDEYFIKQFLSPIYPVDDAVASPTLIEKKIRKCQNFEKEKSALYRVLNDSSDGNALRVQEFFRVGTHYYCATKKLNAVSLEIENIAAMQPEIKRRLCATISHAVYSFHRGGIVHADLKHTNIMFIHSWDGSLTAKVIDFDASFLESNPPKAGEEIVGDQVYFSPEACKSIWGVEVPLTCKMDVFALGVLFHQYLVGCLPKYSECYGSAGLAVANGEVLTISDAVPDKFKSVLSSMLDADPDKRPSAYQVFRTFADATCPEKPAFYIPGNL